MFDMLVENLQQSDSAPDRLIEVASSHLRNPLLFSPLQNDFMHTDGSEIRMRESQEVDVMKDRLARAEQ